MCNRKFTQKFAEHISRMTDGRHYTLKVIGEKDTTGEYTDGKHCETWLSVSMALQCVYLLFDPPMLLMVVQESNSKTYDRLWISLLRRQTRPPWWP